MSAEKFADSTNDKPSPDKSTEGETKVRKIYSGFIKILLTKPYLEGDSLDQVTMDEDLYEVISYFEEEGFPMPVRAVHSVFPEQILAFEEEATDSKYPPLRSLNQYWVLNARERMGELEKIAITLAENFSAVAYAYPEEVATVPLHNAINEPGFPQQAYLQLPPTGIGATWVWNNRNLFGEGVSLTDLEQNWDLNHLEFAGNVPQLEPLSVLNNTAQSHQEHGTAVLGILCAGVNNAGGVGIVPGLDNVWALSHYRRHPFTNQLQSGQVADAIGAMLDSGNIAPGDVLLLEVQRGAGVPTETDILDLDAIRLAVSREIIVIEPAGNRGTNLDEYRRFLAPERILNTNFAAEFEESGAILVGASAPESPPGGNLRHPRFALSNFGSRINCFAWGINVPTIGFDAVAGQRFGGTSAAAAIIAGAAALLQSAHRERTGTFLAPDEMRTWLSDPLAGTTQWPNADEPIGVMPDLETIITNRLP